MSSARRNERKVMVSGIATKDALDRFKYQLSKALSSTRVEDKGQYVVMHEKVRLQNKTFLHVVTYTTDRIFISAPLSMRSEDFDSLATRIVRMAQESIRRLEEKRPLTLLRAKNILEFASRLNMEDEYERMVITILADTSDEIVLREEMRDAEITGPPLDEGIPEKIKRLKDKGKFVYEEDGMKNIRELRNGIVHRGDIPDKTQAVRAFEIARKVLKWCFKE